MHTFLLLENCRLPPRSFERVRVEGAESRGEKNYVAPEDTIFGREDESETEKNSHGRRG